MPDEADEVREESTESSEENQSWLDSWLDRINCRYLRILASVAGGATLLQGLTNTLNVLYAIPPSVLVVVGGALGYFLSTLYEPKKKRK